MRLKIIAGNLLIVLVTGLVSFLVLRTQLAEELVGDVDVTVQHDKTLFARSWQLAAREFTDQVEEQARAGQVRQSFRALDQGQRRRAAYQACERVSRWFEDPSRGRSGAPDIVAITDEVGKVLARDTDLNRMFGVSLTRALPPLRRVLRLGQTAHDVWDESHENKLLQTAMAPIRDEKGAILGALVVGYDLSNGVARAEGRLLGRDIAFVRPEAVYSSTLRRSQVDALESFLFGDHAANTKQVLHSRSGAVAWSQRLADTDYFGALARLPMAPATPVAFVILADRSAMQAPLTVTWVLLLMTVIGAIATIIYGFRLGTALLRPLERIEEGLLTIINGQTNHRIDVHSAELGGLAYRINQLISLFTGDSETDEQGRVSRVPGAPYVPQSPTLESVVMPNPALAGQNQDARLAAQLGAVKEEEHYRQLYAALRTHAQKTGAPVPVEAEFVAQMQRRAAQVQQQQGGRAVRFVAEVQGRNLEFRPLIVS
ncbi:MAG: hypothetical protein ACPGUV_05810 [Polyangiales bacterium]